MKAKFLLFAIISSLIIIGCTKPPDYPNTPEIGFVGFSKNTLQQGDGNNDSLLVVISFTDGDGDLGDRDSLNLFVTDKRTGFLQDQFKIPFIPEQGASNGISGEISFALFTTCCIDYVNHTSCQPSPTPDTLVYQIFIMDRADNKSNVIETAPIFLQCN